MYKQCWLILLLVLASTVSASDSANCLPGGMNSSNTKLCETREILYSGEYADVERKATELGSVIEIYHFLRNNMRYKIYHGAKSNSLNALDGFVANDVDTASLFIAMLRSQGIQSRYASGYVQIPVENVANWLGLDNPSPSLVEELLEALGSSVTIVSGNKVKFEHVWVEALIDYQNYRGMTANNVVCANESERCQWVSLDPSFKQYKYKGGSRNLLSDIEFDYNAYYHADDPQSEFYVEGWQGLNPVEVFEGLANTYLHENYPGKSINDVLDWGTVIPENQVGVLPSTLPFDVIASTVNTFDSIQAHDEVKSPDWTKTLTATVYPLIGGVRCPNVIWPLETMDLATLSTSSMTIVWDRDNSQLLQQKEGATLQVLFDGSSSATIDCGSKGTLAFGEGAEFDLELKLFTAKSGYRGRAVLYPGQNVGGTYVIASGGEESNWKQVNRAYSKLLDAAQRYPLLTHDAELYVDITGNGWDQSDPLYIDYSEARIALEGGLLYAAERLYYTRLQEYQTRYAKLKNLSLLEDGRLGVISSVSSPLEMTGTLFSIMPAGLLIDLKGNFELLPWKNSTDERDSSEFKFLGHLSSALEHQVWQEITGLDAISTVRGLQLATANGNDLLTIVKSDSEDTYEQAFLSSLGFSQNLPEGFSASELTLFGTRYYIWNYNGSTPEPALHALLPTIDGVPAFGNLLSKTINFSVAIRDFLEGYSESEQNLRNMSGTNMAIICNNIFTGSSSFLIGQLQACFNKNKAPISALLDMLKIVDGEGPGFRPLDYVYRSYDNTEDYRLEDILNIQWSLYRDRQEGERWEFLLPSKYVNSNGQKFKVYLAEKNNADNSELSGLYAISPADGGATWGGGYVTASNPLVPSWNTSGVVWTPESGTDISHASFNNTTMTDSLLVSVSNNDLVKAPSTIDPVATVTGNMYHDETDIRISGKALPYLFTRTYNSNSTKTSGPGSSNPNYLPFSQGWTHSYNMRLVANDFGRFPNYGADLAPENENNRTSSITYVDERGGEANYILDDNNTTSQPEPPFAGFDELRINTNEAGQNQIGTHTLTFRNGVKYVFSSSGDMRTPGHTAHLLKIWTPMADGGQWLNFGYTNGKLTSITDSLDIPGRTGLTLSYYPESHVDAGRLHTVSDWANRTWTYFYTGGQLSRVENPQHFGMAYTYVDGTHLLKDIIRPEERSGIKHTVSFGYYDNQRAYNYIDKLDSEESLTYDLYRKRTRITNPRGFVTEHHYDKNGALMKLVEPDQAVLQFENNADGLRYAKTDALGYETAYSYHTSRSLDGAASDTFGKVTRERDALGNTVDYDYGIFDQLTEVKDKRNVRTRNEYYTATNVASGAIRGKLHRVVMPIVTVNGVSRTNVTLAEYKYYGDGTLQEQVEYIDPAQPTRKRVTQYAYNYSASGFTVTQTTTGSGTSLVLEKEFDSLWRLVSETVRRRTSATDATELELTTSYEYDSLDRLVKVTLPTGDIAETSYDQNGKVTQVINRYRLTGQNDSQLHDHCRVDESYPDYHSCTQVSYEYDAADRLVATTDMAGNVTRLELDAMGNILKVIDANGQSTRFEYDAKGRRSAVIDANGYRTETAYDAAGRVTLVTGADGNSTHFSYDALGRLKVVTSPEGRQTQFTEYDGNGNLIKLKDANAVAGTQPVNAHEASVYKVYDEFNRVVSETNGNDETTRYTYDLLGNLTTVVDAKNQRTTFVYNDLGLLTEVKDSRSASTGRSVSITHDELGNPLSVTDRAGQTLHKTYDSLNRLRQVEYLADGSSESLTYDQYGDLVAIANPQVTYRYSYDSFHRLLSKTDSRTGRRLGWTYDNLGNLATKTDYQGEVTYYTYDSTNRLVATGNNGYLGASYQYDGAGRLLSRILSNGVATLYGYDKDGFLTRVTQRAADGSTVDDRRYTPDQVGNITRIVINNSETIDYGYDPAYRLLSANSTDDSHDFAYTYDGVGNRLTKTANGVTHHYVYETGNRLASLRTGSATGPIVKRYDYDDNGNRVRTHDGAGQTIQTLTYDQKGYVTRLAANGDTLEFSYDPNGYRISKRYGEIQNHYLLEGEHLEAVYDQDDRLKASYLRGAVVDEIINGFERDADGKLQNRNFHHDQVNSVIAQTDHNGAVVQALQYGPFGEAVGTASGTNYMQYTGREMDAESGLYYYRARYYDPEIGRFVSEDALGFSGGINFYAYVGNNPLIANDPSGHFLNFIVGGGASVALGGLVRVATGGDFFDAEAMAADFLLGSAGVGLVNVGQKAIKLARLSNVSNIEKARKLGQIGEGQSDIAQGGKKAIESLSGTAKRRFPDKIDDISEKIIEIKNKSSLSKGDANQILDSVLFAESKGYQAILKTRGNATDISSVQYLVDAGRLTVNKIPGISSQGVANISATTSAGIGAVTGLLNSSNYPSSSNSSIVYPAYSK